MKILRGFSEENTRNAWVKAEIEVTEDDLVAMLAEEELPVDAAMKLTAREKFLVLNSLAELCLLEQRVNGNVESVEQIADRAKNFNRIKKEILNKLKKTYVPF